MRELAGLPHVFIVIDSGESSGLRDAVGVEWLARLLQDLCDLLRSETIADAQTRQSMLEAQAALNE